MTTDQPNKYDAAKRSRQKHVEAILNSGPGHKIVVAGPGTGKTYLFRQLLEGKTKTLTLTFVNALVEDLSLDLFGLSEVKTLHSFARQQLKSCTGTTIRVFPQLSAVIQQDALALLGRDIDFDALFHDKANNEAVAFYKKRHLYYGYYGFTDMIYAAVRYFDAHPDKIPRYTQIVVDEYQDFNALEVALIDQLALRSHVVLAGDDDQALYGTLKDASPRHIRDKHSNAPTGYQTFTLPYCSRCTRVIVQAANDIIVNAKRAGHLPGRIEKPFQYYDDPDKDRESDRYPQLLYRKAYAKQIPWFIQKSIQDIATDVRARFSALVLAPTRTTCSYIADTLRKKGFANVSYTEKQESREPTLLEGLNLLLKDRRDNLGWRVAAKPLLSDAEFQRVLLQTVADEKVPLFGDLVPVSIKKEIGALLRIVRTARKDGQVGDTEETIRLLKRLGVDLPTIGMQSLQDELPSSIQPSVDFGVRKINITVTTIPSSKGLSADYVFITYFDDRHFIRAKEKDQVTDQDICGFLVALTRARRQVFLISTENTKEPTFLKWIEKTRVRMVK